MTKVIENIELLKKLQQYLGETEYILADNGLDEGKYVLMKRGYSAFEPKNYKTLTLEEAIDLLPIGYIFNKSSTGYTFHNLGVGGNQVFSGKTKLEPIEKMLEYLIDNNLLKNE